MNDIVFILWIYIQEYTEGLLDHVTVLVGIAIGEEATAGIIHQPFYNYKSEGI